MHLGHWVSQQKSSGQSPKKAYCILGVSSKCILDIGCLNKSHLGKAPRSHIRLLQQRKHEQLTSQLGFRIFEGYKIRMHGHMSSIGQRYMFKSYPSRPSLSIFSYLHVLPLIADFDFDLDAILFLIYRFNSFRFYQFYYIGFIPKPSHNHTYTYTYTTHTTTHTQPYPHVNAHPQPRYEQLTSWLASLGFESSRLTKFECMDIYLLLGKHVCSNLTLIGP